MEFDSSVHKDNKSYGNYVFTGFNIDDATTAGKGYGIRQVDGNDSVEEEDFDIAGLTEAEIYALDPELAEAAYTIDHTSDINYAYSLNKANQSRRLLENANKAPFCVTYKDVKAFGDKDHPTNANIECNAGVYLSAIKPTLLAVHEGWKSVVHGTTILCSKISGRMDNSGQHSVCTQLTLSLSNPFENIINSKVVMHCYHTDNKIQVQGSKLISRSSSAVWMVEHFIKPLVKQHMESNAGLINNINDEILSTAHKRFEEEQNTNLGSNSSCGRCKSPANPLASYPRDQVLSCRNCQQMFHKKCTDRKSLKGNWRKEPWFCEYCTLNYIPRNETEVTATPRTSLLLNPDADSFQPAGIEADPTAYLLQPS